MADNELPSRLLELALLFGTCWVVWIARRIWLGRDRARMFKEHIARSSYRRGLVDLFPIVCFTTQAGGVLLNLIKLATPLGNEPRWLVAVWLGSAFTTAALVLPWARYCIIDLQISSTWWTTVSNRYVISGVLLVQAVAEVVATEYILAAVSAFLAWFWFWNFGRGRGDGWGDIPTDAPLPTGSKSL